MSGNAFYDALIGAGQLSRARLVSDGSQDGKAAGTAVQAARRRPPNAGKGRRPGSKNKWGQDVQRTILTSLDRVGGVAYLTEMAYKEPVAYMGLIGKCVPREMRAEITAELTIKQEIRKNLVDSLVELMMSQAPAIIDVTPTRVAHEASEELAPVEAKERIPGSELNAEHEQREADRAETEAKASEGTRPSDEAITRLSVERNKGSVYVG